MPYAPTRHRRPTVNGLMRHRSRPSPHARGYTKRWRKVRRMYMAGHPLCEDPFGVHGVWSVPGRHVDHIVPLSRGGGDEESNLQTLCASCHSKKTVLYDGGFGGRRRSANKWHGDADDAVTERRDRMASVPACGTRNSARWWRP